MRVALGKHAHLVSSRAEKNFFFALDNVVPLVVSSLIDTNEGGLK
jgi:hypothetical protein